MDKIILKQQDIQKDLLHYTRGTRNSLGCSVLFVILFLLLLFVCIYDLLEGRIKGTVPLIIFSLILLFFANPFSFIKTIKQRQNILNNNIHICKDICYKKEKRVIKSNAGEDMPGNCYTWYFKNTNSFISRDDSHQHLFDSTCNGTEFWLVFVDGEKKPVQFYPTKNYEIVL